MPPDELARWPKLQIARAWAVSFTRGPGEGIALLQAASTEGAAGELLAHVRALRHMLLNMMDRFDDARAFARNELPPLPMGYAFPDAILATSMARLAAVSGDYVEARRLLAVARQAVRGSDSNFNKIFSESVEGLIDLRQGRLQQALGRFRIAARTMLPNRFGPTNGNAMRASCWPRDYTRAAIPTAPAACSMCTCRCRATWGCLTRSLPATSCWPALRLSAAKPTRHTSGWPRWSTWATTVA